MELAELRQLLGDPICWLLILVGPGGIGKTWLATQAAAAQVPGLDQASTSGLAFSDGVFLVDLQPVNSADLIASAVADALQFPHTKGPDLKAPAWYYTRRELLLPDAARGRSAYATCRVPCHLRRGAPRCCPPGAALNQFSFL